jgi:hypothetical protein
MLSTLKKKRSQKFVWELPDGICGALRRQEVGLITRPRKKTLITKEKQFAGSTQNPKKNIETPNQPERKFSQKNYVSYLKV